VSLGGDSRSDTRLLPWVSRWSRPYEIPDYGRPERPPLLCFVSSLVVSSTYPARELVRMTSVRMSVVEIMKRVRVLVLVSLGVAVAGLGTGLGLSLSGSKTGSETGTLTGGIRLFSDSPGGQTEFPLGPGIVVVQAEHHTISTQSVATNHQFRTMLPGITRSRATTFQLCCHRYRTEYRSPLSPCRCHPRGSNVFTARGLNIRCLVRP
jgi:hypothetical protein